jgi:hypothetical protein
MWLYNITKHLDLMKFTSFISLINLKLIGLINDNEVVSDSIGEEILRPIKWLIIFYFTVSHNMLCQMTMSQHVEVLRRTNRSLKRIINLSCHYKIN